MAAMLRASRVNTCCYLTLRRCAHTMLPPLDSTTGSHFTATSPPMVLPESEDANNNSTFSFIHGSMELMAVPKKKVSPHKRGIRNGPKALKPVPVIIRCTLSSDFLSLKRKYKKKDNIATLFNLLCPLHSLEFVAE